MNNKKDFIKLDRVMRKQIDGMLSTLMKNYKLLSSFEYNFIRYLSFSLNDRGITRKQYNRLWLMFKEREVPEKIKKIKKGGRKYNYSQRKNRGGKFKKMKSDIVE